VIAPAAVLGTAVLGGAGALNAVAAPSTSPSSANAAFVADPAAQDSALAAVGQRSQGTAVSRNSIRTAPQAGEPEGTDAMGGEGATTTELQADAAKVAAKAKVAKALAAKKKNELAKSHMWVAPMTRYTLTSGYGWRWGRLHPAQDLAAPIGTPVRAMSTGRVIEAQWSNLGYGYRVIIQYWDGTISWYAHNSRLVVQEGDLVSPGQVVAYSGNTGHSTGPHVHLEIHNANDDKLVPITWLREHGIKL